MRWTLGHVINIEVLHVEDGGKVFEEALEVARVLSEMLGKGKKEGAETLLGKDEDEDVKEVRGSTLMDPAMS